MTSTGDNCPSGSVILTTDDCMNAASQLGKTYKVELSREDFPAGCFFWREYFYFHSEIDPEKTNPSSYYGGVCARGMFAFFKYFFKHCRDINDNPNMYVLFW